MKLLRLLKLSYKIAGDFVQSYNKIRVSINLNLKVDNFLFTSVVEDCRRIVESSENSLETKKRNLIL